MDHFREINFAELFSVLLRRIWLLILCAVVVGGAAYIYTVKFVTPMYSSSVKILVNNRQSFDDSQGVTSADLSTSQRLVQTYISILKSDTVLEKVAAAADMGLTADQVRGMISASSDKTEVFIVSVSHRDPNIAAKIANTIAEIAPEEIAYFVEGSSTKIVDYAKVPKAPYSPNTEKNIMVGMAAGALVAACFVVIQALLDVRIKGEEDLATISSAPVLGMIPDLASESRDQYGYQEYVSKDTKVKEGKSE